jgi:AraC-like DNA-binding protein
MDFEKSIVIKTFEEQGLSYFSLLRLLPCLEITSTPLNGNTCLDICIADFGPMVILSRHNHGPAVEDAILGVNTVAIQLPVPNKEMVERFQGLPGGGGHSPFQMEGARFQWVIPQDFPVMHLHVDKRLLLKVIGLEAMKDYQELCNAHSRRAYEAQALLQSSEALAHALTLGREYSKQGKELDVTQVMSLLSDIFLPLVRSDLVEVKPSTRQKILIRTLDYIRDNFRQPIRLADLAGASSTSIRNLQIVFKQDLDLSPNSYLQQFRLHRFREQLTVSGSVTEAAYSCGFKHLGRLTEQYAKVFECNPSADLMAAPLDSLSLGRSLS